MLERLVENWLDEASERSYQWPFCQMLVAEGHRILHSTRHVPIELGKDIITLAADGTPCAFQLKGNPGGRLSLRDFREIEPQLRELVNYAIVDERIGGRQHRSFLVTNGLIDEDVRLAIQQMNDANVRDGYPHRRLNYYQRGDLLNMAQRLGHSLWPTELEQVSLLLQMLVADGKANVDVEKLHSLLDATLELSKTNRWSTAEVRRRITSAALLVSVTLKNQEAVANHFAIVSAWVQFVAYVVALCEKKRVSAATNASQAIAIAMSRIRVALIDLAKEAIEREPLVEGDPLLDSVFYRARYTLVLSLLSLLWFWCETEGWPSDLDEATVRVFLEQGKSELYLWGEGAIPQLLMFYWFQKATDANAAVESLLASMLAACANRDSQGLTVGLPSPYWTYEDVVRHELAPLLGPDQDPMAEETSGMMSYFAEALLHLLVRTGRKTTCKTLWPNLSHIMFASFRPAHRWQHCLWRTDDGELQQVQPPPTKEWSELLQESRSIRCESVPAALSSNRILHALFLIVFPFRATPEAIRALSYAFDSTWLIGETPIP